ncbi:hypothetical protein AT1219_90151 [Vibrio alginolyticus]
MFALIDLIGSIFFVLSSDTPIRKTMKLFVFYACKHEAGHFYFTYFNLITPLIRQPSA